MYSIAVIDDHQMVLEGFSNMIKRVEPNCIVTTYKSGEEFIMSLRKNAINIPNLVFIDYTMNGLNGADIAYILENEYKNVSKIGFSSDDYLEIVNEFLNHGCNGFISKSTGPQEVVELIKAFKDNKQKHFFNKFFNNKMIKFVANDTKHIFPLALSDKQYLFIKLCKTSSSNEEIATILNMNTDALHKLQQRLYEKFEVKTKSELLGFAYDNKIIQNKH